MWLTSFLRNLDADRPRVRDQRRRHCAAPVRFAPHRLLLQPLEDRALPSLVGPVSFDFDTVNPRSVAVGEFNGDGRPDLATANSARTGRSACSWATATALSRPPAASPPGPIPLPWRWGSSTVTACKTSPWQTRAAPSACSWATATAPSRPPATSPSGLLPFPWRWRMFNGDGLQDLAVANRDSNNVSVLLGNGDGTFQAARNFAVGNWPYSVAVGEFNGDGRPDLATANLRGNTVSVLLGNGDGTFQAARNFAVGANPCFVVVGEFNGDGRPDLAVANGAWLEGTPSVSVLLGNGDGTFQAPRHFAAGSVPQSVAVGEFNGDGRPDLAVVNVFDRNVSVLLGNGNGTFQAPRNFAVGAFPVSVAVGEFNGDGRLDLAVANRDGWTVSVLFGNGAGDFQSPGNFAVGSNPYSVAVGEFNGDGHPDLAVANIGSNTVSVLLGNGDATLQPAQHFATGAAPRSVAVGDFNNDGKLDLATANSGGNDVSVLVGNGDGTFAAAQNVPLQIPFFPVDPPLSVAVGDFNADGKMDLAVGSQISYYVGGSCYCSFGYYGCSYYMVTRSYVTVLLGNGDGTFGTQNTTQLNGGSPMGLAVADFDRDGKLDVATANYDYGTVSVLLGDGTGAVGPPSDFSAGYYPVSVAAGDVDGDGDIDLATANRYGNNVSVLLGNGAGAFAAAQTFGVGSRAALRCLQRLQQRRKAGYRHGQLRRQ